ncbi:MAG: hypothetical protein ABIP55_01815 [Tepidisphaeraceae bacterium]
MLVDPRIPVADAMRRLVPGRPACFDAERDFPLLIEAIRGQMQRQFATDVDQPWPPPPATRPVPDTPRLTLAPTTQPALP